jgi:hypothetical protein
MNSLLDSLRLLYRGIRRLRIVDVTQLMHLPEGALQEQRRPEGYEIRGVQADELNELIQSKRISEQVGNVQALEDGRHAVLAAFREDRAVSFVWFANRTVEAAENYSRASHLGTSIDMPDGTVFVRNAWTDPDDRGKRLIGSIMAYAIRHRVLGACSLLTSIDWTNDKSIRAFEFVGMQPLGNVVRLGLGPLQVSLTPAEAQRLGVRVGADAPGCKVAF